MSDDGDFAAIEQASRDWMQAWIAQDRDALERFLAPDYTLIVSTVPTMPFARANWLDTAIGGYVCTRFDYDGVHFRRITDDLIAMSGIADFDAAIDGVDRSGRYFVTDLWRRTAAGWQVCQRYSSRPGTPDDSVRRIVAAASR